MQRPNRYHRKQPDRSILHNHRQRKDLPISRLRHTACRLSRKLHVLGLAWPSQPSHQFRSSFAHLHLLLQHRSISRYDRWGAISDHCDRSCGRDIITAGFCSLCAYDAQSMFRCEFRDDRDCSAEWTLVHYKQYWQLVSRSFRDLDVTYQS